MIITFNFETQLREAITTMEAAHITKKHRTSHHGRKNSDPLPIRQDQESEGVNVLIGDNQEGGGGEGVAAIAKLCLQSQRHLT